MPNKLICTLIVMLHLAMGCAVQPIRVTKSDPLPSATNDVAVALSGEPMLVGQWIDYEEGLFVEFAQDGTFELNGRSGPYLVDSVKKLITLIPDSDDEQRVLEYTLADNVLTLTTEEDEQVTLRAVSTAPTHPDEQAIFGRWVELEAGLVIEFMPDGLIIYGEEQGRYFLDSAAKLMLLLQDDSQRAEIVQYDLTETLLLLTNEGGDEIQLAPLGEIDLALLLGFWQGQYEDDETFIQYVYQLNDEDMVYRDMTVNKLEQTYSINEASYQWRLDGNIFQQFFPGGDEPLEIVIIDVTEETMTLLFPEDVPFEETRASDFSLPDPPEGFTQIDPITE